ncbi:MAG: TRAP transporter fused permease subunit [Alphaproteobacteria bacterium]|nr:C4-dicarboxylate ABC transporter [Rhodospirillaceae bacterium]MDP6406844.1 TRAP transporter fused permease subunit [Alphaproteobacteria bacterium]MDP6623728.1 TRAP transporter fused permease subunit [Alphaproteobacteria bacterium]
MIRLGVFRASLWFSVGVRRRPTGALGWFFTTVSVAIAVFVITAATFIIIGPWTLGMLFTCGMMTIGFLTVGAFENSDPDRPSPLDWLLSGVALASGIYFSLQAGVVEERISLLDELTAWDLVFSTAVLLLAIEVTRRTTGLGLTMVALLFIAYNFWGHLLSGVLQHGLIGYEHFADIMMFTTDGIFGLPIRVAATYAFLFVLFGTTLQATGGGDFFFDFAASISGRHPGGPAKVAVVSSGLYGMVSGSPTSDVVTTGSITIPIMRKLGYKRALAGAVEVAASTGGSVVPPVMGSAAFIMAEYTGIEYQDIAIAAIVPALLYYVCVYSQVHFRSLKMGLRPLDDDQIPPFVETMKQGGLFFVPLVAITVALFNGYTPTMVAVFGTIAVLAVAMLKSKTRIGPVTMIKVLAETCYRMVPVAGACAAAGLIIGGITMTGLAAKFAHVIYLITEAQLFSSLLLAAALTIVLGLGMPTPSAYILAGVLMGPLLDDLGVPILAAHMFLLYYAVMSAITPPVAVAAYAAASIAEDNPLHIAVLSVRLALAAFVVPFGFIYRPEILLVGAPLGILGATLSAVLGVFLLALAVEGYWRGELRSWQRLLLAAAGLSMFASSLPITLVGLAVAALLWLATPGMRKPRPHPEGAE